MYIQINIDNFLIVPLNENSECIWAGGIFEECQVINGSVSVLNLTQMLSAICELTICVVPYFVDTDI